MTAVWCVALWGEHRVVRWWTRLWLGSVLAALTMPGLMPPAQAQALAEGLFGPRQVPRDAVAMAPPPGVRITVHPRTDTGLPGDGSAPTASGPYAAYCVRTCDGRFFPMPVSRKHHPTMAQISKRSPTIPKHFKNAAEC